MNVSLMQEWGCWVVLPLTVVKKKALNIPAENEKGLFLGSKGMS